MYLKKQWRFTEFYLHSNIFVLKTRLLYVAYSTAPSAGQRSNGLSHKLNRQKCHDSHGFVAADIRFARGSISLTHLPIFQSGWEISFDQTVWQSTCQTFISSQRNGLTYPHWSWPPPHSILQHFRSFHSVCHLLSACPSIHPGSMFSLLSGSGINLRSGFHFNSGLLTVEVLCLCKWVHQAAGVIRVSRHGDRLPVPHADIQSCSLFRQSCGNGLWGDGLRDPPLLSEEFLENAFKGPGG